MHVARHTLLYVGPPRAAGSGEPGRSSGSAGAGPAGGWNRRALLTGAALCLAALPLACRMHHGQAGVLVTEAGRRQFQSYCAACHQYDGQGMGDAPPLVRSPWVTGPPERLIKIALHGVQGRMEISGKIYDREMPGFGAVLADEDLAALLSYVRRDLGGLHEAITSQMIGRVRAAHQNRTEYWDAGELLDAP